MVAVIAGPGTGKTGTLVERIAWLVEERGVKPREITAVTFTNQAAAEMRQRLEARLGGRRAVAGMTIGTFHAICLQLLGDVRLISPGEALTAAEEVLRAAGSKMKGRAFLQAVSRVKNGAVPAEAGLDEALLEPTAPGWRPWGPWTSTTCSPPPSPWTPPDSGASPTCWWTSSRTSTTPSTIWSAPGAGAGRASLSSATRTSPSTASGGPAGSASSA